MTDAVVSQSRTGLVRLRLEFALLYLAAPLGMAGLVAGGIVSPRDIPGAFVILFLFTVVLLFRTPTFRWRSLMTGGLIPDWRIAALFTVVTVSATVALTQLLAPWAMFSLPRNAPEIWWRVLFFYPVLSVLPQSLIYRVLFFARYGDLFPGRTAAIAVNATVFGMAHLFYLNWPAVALTAIGGAVFAWIYTERGAFWFANLLHAIAGWTLFTVGLGGVYFFHGSI